jgi:hypothetical protein
LLSVETDNPPPFVPVAEVAERISMITIVSDDSRGDWGRVLEEKMGIRVVQPLLSHIVGCRALVLVSPVVFGGVSYHIKKVMDRMTTVADPRYRERNGELVKGMHNRNMRYYMVGIGSGLSERERSTFLFLHEENRKIMDVKGRAFILEDPTNQVALAQITQEIIHG